MLARDAVVLVSRDLHRPVGLLLAIHADLDLWILHGAPVPGPGPVMGGYVDPTVALPASEDAVARVAG